MSTDGTSGGHVAILNSWFAAFNAHDVDALCLLADPGVEVIPLEDARTVPPGTTAARACGRC